MSCLSPLYCYALSCHTKTKATEKETILKSLAPGSVTQNQCNYCVLRSKQPGSLRRKIRKPNVGVQVPIEMLQTHPLNQKNPTNQKKPTKHPKPKQTNSLKSKTPHVTVGKLACPENELDVYTHKTQNLYKKKEIKYLQESQMPRISRAETHFYILLIVLTGLFYAFNVSS